MLRPFDVNETVLYRDPFGSGMFVVITRLIDRPYKALIVRLEDGREISVNTTSCEHLN